MEGSFEVRKIIKFTTVQQIVKGANLMCISFSDKHPQTSWESRLSLSNMSRTISNMYTYPFNPQLVIKT